MVERTSCDATMYSALVDGGSIERGYRVIGPVTHARCGALSPGHRRQFRRATQKEDLTAAGLPSVSWSRWRPDSRR